MAYFYLISPIFGPKKVFSKNSSSVRHNLIRVSSTMPKFREMQWFNSKKTPGQAAGWKDRQTLFHRILPATTRGLASTTAVDWHLKVKYIEYNVGVTKNYCITVSMQKISSIHTLILKIQQIWGSHELNKWSHPFLPHSALLVNIIHLLVIMNKKIKKPPAKLNFQQSQ